MNKFERGRVEHRIVRKLIFALWVACLASGCVSADPQPSVNQMVAGSWEPSWESHFRGRLEPGPARYGPKPCFQKSVYHLEDRPSNKNSWIPLTRIAIRRCKTEKTQFTLSDVVDSVPSGRE